jgi:hypothetical protein
VNFEAQSHGLRPRCLRFAGALAVPPTQDSLLAGGQPLPGGSRTRWVPSGKFPALSTRVYITFLLPQALPGALRPSPISRPGHLSGRRAGPPPIGARKKPFYAASARRRPSPHCKLSTPSQTARANDCTTSPSTVPGRNAPYTTANAVHTASAAKAKDDQRSEPV